MKNIFTTTVRWFKKDPTPPVQHDWTHVYNNSLGNPVRCIIQRGVYDTGTYVWILNENGCGVGMNTNDLQLITKVLPS